MKIGALIGLVVAALVAFYVSTRPLSRTPDIQGALVEARALAPFILHDTQAQEFTRDSISGEWHLVSYGFTHCPDVCPMLLQELVKTKRLLEEKALDLRYIFYSVDQHRDDATQLQHYLEYFDSDFIGLIVHPQYPAAAKVFENSLGIVAEVSRSEAGEINVLHGAQIFLLNPSGELVAVLYPNQIPGRIPHFQAKRLADDIEKVLRFIQAKKTAPKDHLALSSEHLNAQGDF